MSKAGMCSECGDGAQRVRKGKKFKLCEDCRREDTVRRWKVRSVRRDLQECVGKLVQFNEGTGWKAGYLIKFGSYNDAHIQPIGALGRIPDITSVSLAHVKVETHQSPSMPTVEDFYRVNEKKKVLVLVAGGKSVVAEAVAALYQAQKTLHAGFDLSERVDISVQEVKPFTPREHEPLLNRGEHPPVDIEEAARLYLADTPMSAIVEKLRGARAAGGCGNLIRKALRAKGIYKEPVK